jgi:hypothetical protein
MSFYRIDRIHQSDLHALSMGNIPIRVTDSPFGDRLELVDPNPTAPAIDPDGCDTPNFSLRTCDSTHAERLRSANSDLRKAATQFLISKLGRRAAAKLATLDDQFLRSMAAFFGDPDFRRASGKYRRLRRLDTHAKLGSDASWFTSHHFAPTQEIVK